jgi:hypothetical protein
MIIRPFTVEYEVLKVPELLEVTISFAAPTDLSIEKDVVEVLTAFGRLGQVGGLAGEDDNPVFTNLRLISSEFKPQTSRWIFGDVQIDQGSICILLNMIHYLHLEAAPIARVRIAWQNLRDIENPSALEFPGLWPRLSFQLEFGEMLDDIDFAIRFLKPENKDVLDIVVNTMAAWLLATHRGAYADDAFNPSDTAVFLGPDVMSISPNRIVWYIEVMRCNEDAFNGLINVLEWVHLNIAGIESVEVGPVDLD